MSVVIPLNTAYPTKVQKTYTNSKDGKTSLILDLYQGNSENTNNNTSLGSLNLNIPPLKKGELKAKVTFEIDNDGLLNVTAEEVSQGQPQKIVITNEYALTHEEKRQMKATIEILTKQKNVQDEKLEAKTEFETLIYNMSNLHNKITLNAMQKMVL